MREGLTVIIVLLIVGILLDGLRRVRRARREGLRISRKARTLNPEDFPESGSEICGEPRVVRQRDKRDAETLTKTMRESFAKSRVTVGAPVGRIPEQVTLNLQESVPMLMDSVDEFRPTAAQPKKRDYTQPPSWAEPQPVVAGYQEDDEDVPHDKQRYEEQSFEEDDYDELREDNFANNEDDYADSPWQDDEPSLGSLDALADDSQDGYDEPAPVQEKAPRQSSAASKDERLGSKSSSKSSPAREEPSEVLIINLMARAGQRFDGNDLLNALLDHGLRFGEMNIFHRHKYADGSGPVQFSLANMVVPGTFDLSAMEDFSTPGVSMFLSLPNDDDSLAAFDRMAETAKALAKELDGELKDENRSVMTRQTLEHCRQRVLEFERKQRLMQHS